MKAVVDFIWNMLAGVGLVAAFFLLIAWMDPVKPDPVKPDTNVSDNLSGRPAPKPNRYREKNYKAPKPSKLPSAPTPPSHSFKDLQAPSKLPQAPHYKSTP